MSKNNGKTPEAEKTPKPPEVLVANAKIVATHLGADSNGVLTAFIQLEFEGGKKLFGGFELDEILVYKDERLRVGSAYGMEFLRVLLLVIEAPIWEKTIGTFCRAKLVTKDGVQGIAEVGHITKDQWFNPVALKAEMVRRVLLENAPVLAALTKAQETIMDLQPVRKVRGSRPNKLTHEAIENAVALLNARATR